MEDAPILPAPEPHNEVVDEKDGGGNVSTLITGDPDIRSDETPQEQKMDMPEKTNEPEHSLEEEQATAGAEPEAEVTTEDTTDEHQGEMVVEAEEDTVIY